MMDKNSRITNIRGRSVIKGANATFYSLPIIVLQGLGENED